MRIIKLGALALVLQLSACAADHAAPRVQQILTSTQCGYARAGIHLVTGQAQWQQLPLNQWSGKSRQLEWQQGPWRLVVAMGHQPTLGYGLTLVNATQQSDRLTVSVKRQQPQPGHARGEMLTSPCLVLSIPGQGWSRLVVNGLDRQPITLHHP